LASSVLYAYLIKKGKTLYPKWMALFNPIFILIILFPALFILPYPIGGYIAPAYFNISTFIFFCISTKVLYKRMACR